MLPLSLIEVHCFMYFVPGLLGTLPFIIFSVDMRAYRVQIFGVAVIRGHIL